MRKLFVAGAASLLMVYAIAVRAAESDRNLIVNPSFENADGDNPQGNGQISPAMVKPPSGYI